MTRDPLSTTALLQRIERLKQEVDELKTSRIVMGCLCFACGFIWGWWARR